MLLNIPGIILVVLNVIITYMGFKDRKLFERHAFDVDAILMRREYHRMLTSGFFHVSWNHLIFNMISLYLFSDSLVLYAGYAGYFLIYFGSLLGGNLLALWDAPQSWRLPRRWGFGRHQRTDFCDRAV
jgi:membrane associated rhomboid family serine protease